MIDTISETILDFRAAAKEIDRLRRGTKLDSEMEQIRRNMSISTIYRYSNTGCRGVILETIHIGTTRCTSREALQRFFEKISLASVGARNVSPGVDGEPAAGMAKRSERAGKALEMLGI